jgi:hypothetical protein
VAVVAVVRATRRRCRAIVILLQRVRTQEQHMAIHVRFVHGCRVRVRVRNGMDAVRRATRVHTIHGGEHAAYARTHVLTDARDGSTSSVADSVRRVLGVRVPHQRTRHARRLAPLVCAFSRVHMHRYRESHAHHLLNLSVHTAAIHVPRTTGLRG